MRSQLWVLVPVMLLGFGIAARGDDKKSGLNDEGFVQQWLVLAPIPFGASANGADALDKEQVKDEAKLKPKAGDKIKAGDKDLVWKAHECKEHFLEFNEFLGATTEDSVGYAVTFIVAPDEIKGVKMKTGSDDQAKVFLNGKEVFKIADARPLDKDQDTTEVTLKKGVNVLVFKVVNEKMDWSCCVRFTGKDDKPLKNLKAQTKE